MHTLYRDLRLSVRHLTKSPGFTVIALVVLALGIGANAAVFTILNSLLLKPLIGNAPGDLLGVYARERTKPRSYRSFSYPELQDLRQCPEIFDRVGAFEMAVLGIREGEGTRRAFGAIVSSDYFATVGTRMALGREFTLEEELAGSAPVAILSYPFWRSLGADPAILGGPVNVNGTTFTIVGVTPAGFSGTTALITPKVWLPLGAYSLISNETLRGLGRGTMADRSTRSLLIIARLRPELAASDAGPLLASVSSKLERQWPGENKDLELLVHSLSRFTPSTYPSSDSEVSIALGFLMGMSAIVLLIASLNLANMMLARGGARSREIAIKMAIGCTRWHVIRQLLMESLLLSASGGAIGLALGGIATQLLSKTLMPIVPLAITFDAVPDWRVLGATSVFCILATLVFGMGPALKLARIDLVAGIKQQSADLGGRGHRFRVSSALVVAQVALSLALLTAGGLFLEGAWKASSADIGLTFENGVLINVDGSMAQYNEARCRQVMRETLSRIRALGQVSSASVASVVPLGEYSDGCSVQPVGERKAEAVGTIFTIVGADYFRTIGVSVLRGREFSPSEEMQRSALCPVVVDVTLAQRLWPGQDPIGRNLRIEDPGTSKPSGMLEVIGVVPSIRPGLSKGEAANLYVPYGDQFRSDMTIHVLGRTGGEVAESSLLQAALGELRSVDPKLPVLAAKTLRGHRDTSIYMFTARTGARLFTVMALLALILAATGLYGIRAFVVSTRTKEIGIRMAIGASRADAMKLVLGEGMRLALTGIAAGFALAVPVAWALGGWVYGVDTFEPGAMIGAPLVLMAALLLASYIPARRAATIAPMEALRQE